MSVLIHDRKCSRTRELIKTPQVRPYYEGSEILETLVICPECASYAFHEFNGDRKSQQDIDEDDL